MPKYVVRDRRGATGGVAAGGAAASAAATSSSASVDSAAAQYHIATPDLAIAAAQWHWQCSATRLAKFQSNASARRVELPARRRRRRPAADSSAA